ncbi:MAG TPA: xanthine dehydrogenase family protein molybdopterin-binding subunit [Methylomirabilota bacterium]|nr:xanthine dehydrogenase family protein molybdopterin-binding subunit [Methylomirabilota bacterium]
MAKAEWAAARRSLIGKRISRLDGPAKTTGAARYAYDINRPGMLYAKIVASPHAHAKVLAIDTKPAEDMAGVRAVWKDPEMIGKEVNYVGALVAVVAAETEEIATEAASRVMVQYEVLEHQVVDHKADLSKDRPSQRTQGDVEDALKKAHTTVQGFYGVPVITHCCLEPHGQVTEMKDGDLLVWPSTQNVSKYSTGLGEAAGVDQNRIRVDCQYMGGGFGSKFNFDRWGAIGAILAKQTGRPVKLMLDRDLELATAGSRPSAFANIKIGAASDGTVTALDAEIWGTSGMGGSIPTQMPYVFKVPNFRVVGKRIQTHRGSARAWRAPNHPQNCVLTMCAYADLAAKMGMDELDFFLRNVQFTDRPAVYTEEFKIAADLIKYREKAHPRGDRTPGPIKRGLGVSLHTWGGLGHDSECDVTINPDGSVETRMGTQDLGVGTRTCLGIVVADTLGLPLEAVHVQIGRSDYPVSGASGGSTTIGGISTASRKAATAALNALFDVVAPKLGVTPDQLEAVGGEVRQIGRPANKLAWKHACALLGVSPITRRGVSIRGESEKAGFTSQGVGGVQIADVSVDIETGVVTMNELVAVQDCGLIIDLKLAESQVYGAMIMGITSALYEEAVYDATTGRMLNADMEFYRLAGIKDVGKLTVHMMTGKGYDERGVIGLGEPPVISPAAAISNAVANAIGTRVPNLPLTPDRVLTALAEKGGVA